MNSTAEIIPFDLHGNLPFDPDRPKCSLCAQSLHAYGLRISDFSIDGLNFGC